MPDDIQPSLVVTAIHTQTSVYVRPDGEKFPFFALECFVGPDSIPGPQLLFDMQLWIGIIGDIVKMMKTVYGISDMPSDPSQMDIPFDPDAYPPAPDDPYEHQQDPPDPPDRTGDR